MCLFVFCLLFVSSASAQERLYPNEFPLQDVILLNSPFKTARDLNIKTLLQYKVDRLLAPYRKEAGWVPKDSSYPNWIGLDGHIGGHYLSALAMNVAATDNAACRKRMDYMIDELKACQEANTLHHPSWGKGYLGGIPNSAAIWSTLKAGDFKAYHAAWVPWYNVHKMYAGLRDVWLYTGNKEAKEMFLNFCDWGIFITAKLSEQQMQSMLDTEHGGMDEMFADAYQMTGDKKYIIAAERFSHHVILDPMSKGIDNLDNKHANTQIPKVVGFQRIAELTENQKFVKAASFFWEAVTTHRSLAFGGNSRKEFFPSAAACMDYIHDVEGPESCNSYNMLKLTEDLFRTHPLAKYADYYERTLYNHILSIQNPITGGYVYFTPVRPRSYKVYSAPNEAMWCCVGSGMEDHSKYNQFIYTHQQDSLYLNLFIASILNWKEKGVEIKQQTTFPYEEKTKLIITKGRSHFTLMIRYPEWVSKGKLQIKVNGKALIYDKNPGSYIGINRQWKKGDVIEVLLPMHNSIEHLPNVPDYIAIMHGPILLGAKTGTEDMKGMIADDSRWGHIPSGKMLPLNTAPIIIADSLSEITNSLVPIKNKPLYFTTPNLQLINPIHVVLEPFYKIQQSRYMMYWLTLNKTQYHRYLDSIAHTEKEALALQNRTIDFVAPGEQQPEVDHHLQKINSNTGNYLNEFWREASKGGYFSYELSTNGQSNLSLMVRYFGKEEGDRKFDIYIDGQKLISFDNTERWNQSHFFNVTYPIPNNLLNGKNQITVKFQALPESTVGAVYYVRVLKNNI
ncbi:hypothetical protein D6B99_09000 [Arachidicoccus soli]|uniref:Uncharacterized protein n=2 Tax=Arachidicoccus soli TaxID=2341117 RepID=A0A386HV42_9BACT|nr:hypothetical protein D6B99_09000 [Arachidicoccus soli]